MSLERYPTMEIMEAERRAREHSHAEDSIILRAQMQRIIDHYDLRSVMYTNDADLAAGLAAIAREAMRQVQR